MDILLRKKFRSRFRIAGALIASGLLAAFFQNFTYEKPPEGFITVYQFQNTTAKFHYYTTELPDGFALNLDSQGVAFVLRAAPGNGLQPLYQCTLPHGNMTSRSASCEGFGTGVLLGYVHESHAAGTEELARYLSSDGAADRITEVMAVAKDDKALKDYKTEKNLGFVDVPKWLSVMPQDTDPSITRANTPHRAGYYTGYPNSKLLLFLPGTNGYGLNSGPNSFLAAALAQGYRVLDLTYIDDKAVAQICKMTQDPTQAVIYKGCPDKFRAKRFFGDNVTSLITDGPHDSILNRVTKLLQYLEVQDPAGNWQQYLNGSHPKWSLIAIAGQSQGGGMGEFAGKVLNLDRIIAFSGGWDKSPDGAYAGWYNQAATTPMDRWYATYNKFEPNANDLSAIYKLEHLQPDHVFELSLPVRPGHTEAHPEGISNPNYIRVWLYMLGRGTL